MLLRDPLKANRHSADRDLDMAYSIEGVGRNKVYLSGSGDERLSTPGYRILRRSIWGLQEKKEKDASAWTHESRM